MVIFGGQVTGRQMFGGAAVSFTTVAVRRHASER